MMMMTVVITSAREGPRQLQAWANSADEGNASGSALYEQHDDRGAIFFSSLAEETSRETQRT